MISSLPARVLTKGPIKFWVAIFQEPFRSNRRQLLSIFLALIVLGVSQSLFLFLVGPFIKVLFASEQIKEGVIHLHQLLPEFFHSFSWAKTIVSYKQLVYWVPGLLGAAGLMQALAKYIYQANQQFISLSVANNLRKELFFGIISQPYLELKRRSSGAWMSMIMNDILFLQNRFSDFLTCIVRDGVLSLACLVSLSIINPIAAILLLVFMLPIMLILGSAGRRIVKYAEGFQTQLSKLAQSFLALRQRFEFIRSQQGENWESHQFQKANEKYFRDIKGSLFIRASIAPGMEFFGFLIFVLFIFMAQKQWIIEVPKETFVQFIAALGLMLRPLKNLGEQMGRFKETQGAMSHCLRFLKTNPIHNADEPVRTIRNSPLMIKHVTISYDNGPSMAITNLNLHPGCSYLVIGPSGAGKSTLMRCLAGLIPPEEWQANIPWEVLRRNSLFVSQESFLFSDSLRRNLCYGNHSTMTDKKIYHTLSWLNMDEFVSSLPQALDTTMSATMSLVSGGQQQRLIIARALMDHQPLWLLDEPTAALDHENESKVMSTVINLANEQGAILVVVSHRLGYIDKFDEVIFMENGHNIAQAHHDDLLSNSRYQQFIKGEELSIGHDSYQNFRQ